MHHFRDAVEDCGLSDLRCEGYQYSFSNRRKGVDEVQAKLDRVLITQDWRSLFPQATAKYVVAFSSDHQVIFIDTDGRMIGRRKKLFRVEEMWFKHPEFKRDLQVFWEAQSGCRHSWTSKLRSCSHFLRRWNSKTYGNVRDKIEKLKEKVERLRMGTKQRHLLY
ncbi:hypothetical protein QQ045_017737 [Rhodiola kirilowii]